MLQLITTIQIISAILLIVAILLQQRGVGLGSAFGGEGAIYRTKRGIEKGIFISTIVFAIIFFASALAGVILR
ncbi:preprotein translocase subunit SecG [Candidatus Uhrbacteria bacterium RIFCSPLOWO2_01_FULL_47_24]|uniref:Protein-export membrane protein SecG n=1 Tax=Candidatus Uhrbacteria bacterium RIFCSPLOWO2_01_FULL_47_24 TaxID=1802401 RepID=A0A1F7UNU7_9BACT|nr:MAG: preprotein translocase subunit SecG [Candidatus Uhrbacteria bacterium RIFCSPHIGHO2_01_FULL_47_11]OGL67760.1 MAG: preprotein translocase subunit SecG [Candidatus Uhrbacteria bacterium RIFCSPHIGHO2_02_FULL_46_47]OGL76649.1 MAG: preprotein translocase subunit SecG [Candidatus Uhrbacteria bacterium RIFCSPHIGHO2_12_FULL_47_11]OGL79973.1 MAG: preprotein translocase subunit SecG [Candidatus Uhrbacteria bacterium RIFCSPLOWO2_01_FULL_47_24]OGL84354.1 MAG: preprotein translocase subunit SecG [Can